MNSSDEVMEATNENEVDSEEEIFQNSRGLFMSQQDAESDGSEVEVMSLNKQDKEKDMASDIEENLDLPSDKAWGRKKKDYYSTDYVDADYAFTSHKDTADAEMEENDAKNLQLRLAQQLDETDFGFDLIESKQVDCNFDKTDDKIKVDWSKLSRRQKHEFLNKESPEFLPLIHDLKEHLMEAKNVLKPFLDLTKNIKCENDRKIIDFIKLKYKLLLHYCTNISFYLILKSKQESTINHAIIKRLAQYRHLLAQIENCQGNLLCDVKKTLKASNGKRLYNSTGSNINKKINKTCIQGVAKSFKENSDNQKNNIENYSKNDNSLNDSKEDSICAKSEYSECEKSKRMITYQIAKNRGLTPYRKKEQRNPRVKHRNKYSKAKIRRRGAVKEVRKEITRYIGESSGIKTNVSKSIKIK